MIKKKKDWMHGEGVAQTVYALQQAEIWDEETWKMLKEKIEDKDFDYTVVKQGRWSATNFQTLSGKEHLFQSDLSEFANKLFFNGK